ncbi:MAG: NAD-dependent epimerase/dehydratase family protein [Bacteroidetes bacterium]|nr:NAD-dependent epimerase/dehydratase family protein [Bacteroidota bacterium]
MKALVTGANGFVGQYVIEELLKRNIEVIATSANKQKAESKTWYSKVKFVAFDYSQKLPENSCAFFNNPDVLIHLAWGFLPMFKAPEHITVELIYQKQFLTQMIQSGVKNINVVGTCLEYGLQEGELREDMPCKPIVPYAEAKFQLLNYLFELQQKTPFNLNWLRLFYMYGKGQSEKSILPQLEKALANNDTVFNMSKGDQERDYLPIETIAKLIVNTSLAQANNGVVNICSGKPITVKQLVEDYLSEKNKKISLNLGFYPYPDYEPFKFWGSCEKINKIKI